MYRRFIAPALTLVFSEIARQLPGDQHASARRKHERRARNKYSFLYPKNGEQECARRRRQIADGHLTVANGLIVEGSAQDAAA